jgi:hypothetical protein
MTILNRQDRHFPRQAVVFASAGGGEEWSNSMKRKGKYQIRLHSCADPVLNLSITPHLLILDVFKSITDNNVGVDSKYGHI